VDGKGMTEVERHDVKKESEEEKVATIEQPITEKLVQVEHVTHQAAAP
jgi:Na+-transporting methylmalonyl-CoA/oxaloacetate decarboxylase gamma subunit